MGGFERTRCLHSHRGSQRLEKTASFSVSQDQLAIKRIQYSGVVVLQGPAAFSCCAVSSGDEQHRPVIHPPYWAQKPTAQGVSLGLLFCFRSIYPFNRRDVLKYMHEHKAGLTHAAVKPVSKPKEPVRQPASKPLPPHAAFTDIPLTNMRRTIAKRLTESKVPPN